MSDSHQIELSDQAIGQLVAQIKAAIGSVNAESSGQRSPIEIESFDLHLRASLREAHKVGAKLSWWFELSADRERVQAHTQTLKMSFRALSTGTLGTKGVNVEEHLKEALALVANTARLSSESPPSFPFERGSVELELNLEQNGQFSLALGASSNRGNTHTVILHLRGKSNSPGSAGRS